MKHTITIGIVAFVLAGCEENRISGSAHAENVRFSKLERLGFTNILPGEPATYLKSVWFAKKDGELHKITFEATSRLTTAFNAIPTEIQPVRVVNSSNLEREAK